MTSLSVHWSTLMGSAAVFAFLNLSRFCVDTSILHRPAMAALLWSLATSDPEIVLIGVFFELLWLDLFPAGAYIPPNGLLAFCMAAVTLAHIPEPTMAITLIILLGAAIGGHAAAAVELAYRKRQDSTLLFLAETNRRTRLPQFLPDVLVTRALAEQWVLGWILFLSLTISLIAALALATRLPLPATPTSWPILLIPALGGGLLALRTRRALATAAVAFVGGLAITLLG